MYTHNNTPKITIVGTHGRNLSLYLKDHLAEKGIRSFAVGLQFKSTSSIRRIKMCETLICLHADILKETEAEYDLSEKTVICLDVADTPPGAESKKPVTGETWLEYQREYAYPQIEAQIKKHLSKLS